MVSRIKTWARLLSRPGRPIDVISHHEMIDRVERLVLNDRRIKVAKHASDCGTSNESVFTIIHEHSGMSKVPSRSSAKGGVKARTSGSVQCQFRRLFILVL